ncbi:MAG: hypothetical protein LBH43_13150 [Treponema sp.]|jgi:hypothetical protein|nr:hypothetical protein [Treponema sp.]
MKKKSIILILAALILPLAGLAAQQPQTYSILSFDIGYGPGYDLKNKEVINLQNFGINVRVAGSLSVGAYYGEVSGSAVKMLKIKYEMTPELRFMFGYGSGNLTSLGFEAAPFKRHISGLYSEFKLSPEYSFEPGNIGEGKLLFGLFVGIGF